jgi:hypothetical protein
VRQLGVTPISTVSQGADAVMHQITGDVQSGQFFNGLQPRPYAPANDEAVRAKLREVSMQLTGLK